MNFKNLKTFFHLDLRYVKMLANESYVQFKILLLVNLTKFKSLPNQ